MTSQSKNFGTEGYEIVVIMGNLPEDAFVKVILYPTMSVSE